jgi:hypothetical protein
MEKDLLEDNALDVSLAAGRRKVDSGAGTRQECQGKSREVDAHRLGVR